MRSSSKSQRDRSTTTRITTSWFSIPKVLVLVSQRDRSTTTRITTQTESLTESPTECQRDRSTTTRITTAINPIITIENIGQRDRSTTTRITTLNQLYPSKFLLKSERQIHYNKDYDYLLRCLGQNLSFVREIDPLQQGLRQACWISFKSFAFSQRDRSTTTRITTF